VWKEEYACYKDARCERQSNGTCGWTQTEELNYCLGTTETPPVAITQTPLPSPNPTSIPKILPTITIPPLLNPNEKQISVTPIQDIIKPTDIPDQTKDNTEEKTETSEVTEKKNTTSSENKLVKLLSTLTFKKEQSTQARNTLSTNVFFQQLIKIKESLKAKLAVSYTL